LVGRKHFRPRERAPDPFRGPLKKNQNNVTRTIFSRE